MTVQDELVSAMGGERGGPAANRLCEACVVLLGVDAVAISLIVDGGDTATLGASSAPARLYDEVQFTLGEGPCLDAVERRTAILVPDLADPDDVRWPAYCPAMQAQKIRCVCALPVTVAGAYVGALDLFRRQAGPLSAHELTGAFAAAEMAELPILDLLGNELLAAVTNPTSDAWLELSNLTRTEVSQATGMVMAQLGVDAAEALVRLRAHAYATDRTASAVARDILNRRLRLEPS